MKKKIQPEYSTEKITLQKTQLKLKENYKDLIKTNWKKIQPENSAEKITWQKAQH